MLNFDSPLFLRRILFADAAASAATGALLAFGSEPLAPLLGLPAALLQGAGIALLPFAALLAWLAGRAQRMRGAVWAVVAVNVIWVMDSAALLLSGWVSPTLAGHAFVIAQAIAVAALAELEYAGLRPPRTAVRTC